MSGWQRSLSGGGGGALMFSVELSEGGRSRKNDVVCIIITQSRGRGSSLKCTV